MSLGPIATPALDDYFQAKLSNCEIIYVPNFGNAGDALIGLGTLRFFSRLGIRWTLRRDWWQVKEKAVVFAGGGALVGHYPRSENAFATLLRNGNQVIVLPHTITRLDESLLKWGANLTVFCRERRTFDYLSQFKQIQHLGIDHDMAFQLAGQSDEYSHRSFLSLLVGGLLDGSIKDRLRVVKRFPRALRVFNQTRRLARGRADSRLNCFRKDVESAGHDIPSGNHDISNDYAMGTESVGSIKLSAHALLSTVNQFPEIHTDRLHCCIAALLLGKRVRFFGNNYHKNRSVYEFSIRHRTANVVWSED